MILYLILPLVFFYLGKVVQDIKNRNRIMNAASPYLDPIAFEGDVIDYVKNLSILETEELGDVLQRL
jgi:hypothetical protein